MIALCIDGISNSKVQLEPDVIYRVGRRLGLEFYIDEESIELAHATITLISGGIVRIAAVTGIVFVNGHETGLEVKSICEADAINGIVVLRFGNVLAKLRFDACNSANETNGFVDEFKDKSLNITTDIVSISESEPQTANNTVNMDGFGFVEEVKDKSRKTSTASDTFVIPETQAFSLNGSAIVSKLPQISPYEDDPIPETQDVRRSITDNAIAMDKNHDNKDVDSELGSQIRICTQTANNTVNRDSFGFVEEVKDKSLNITTDIVSISESEPETANNTVNMDGFGFVEEVKDKSLNITTESVTFVIPETQAFSLNGSAIVSKLPQISLYEDDPIPETQDVRRSITDNAIVMDKNHDNEDVYSELGSQIRICTQDFNADAIDDFDSSVLVGDSKLSSLKPLQERDDKAGPDMDMSAMKLSTSNSQHIALNITKASDTSEGADGCITPELSISGQHSEESNTDGSTSPDIFDVIIAHQKYRSTVAALRSTSKNAEIQNQSVARAETPDDTPTDPLEHMIRLNVTAEVHSYKEDFMESQVIPTKKSSSDMPSGNQFQLDLHWTQTLIKPAQKSLSVPNDEVDTSLNSANADVGDCLQVPDTIRVGDEIDKELSQLIALSALEEEEHHIDQANFENSHKKASSKSKRSQIAEKQSEEKLSRHSVSFLLEPSESSIPMQTRRKQISQPTGSTEPAAESANVNNTIKTRSRRFAATNRGPPAKKGRGKNLQPTDGANAEAEDGLHMPDTIKMGDEINKKLSQLIVLSALEEEEHHIDQANFENSHKKLPSKSKRSQIAEKQSEEKLSRHSVSFLLEPSESSIPMQTRKKQISQPTDSTEPAAESANVNNKIKTRSRRFAATNQGPPVKKGRGKNLQPTDEANHVDGSMHSRQKSVESTETKQADEMPTTSANARRMGTRRSRDPNPLKDINEYIRKIKVSGRKIRVAFSMCNSKELNSVIDLLKNDIDVTSDPEECDVLIMDKGERTYKFLVAVASNKPILCTQWLYEMEKTRFIAVQPNHVFKDESFEMIFKFRPLSVFEKPRLLKGHHFLLGTNIRPIPTEMKVIIVSAGGKVYSKRPSIASKFKLFAVVSKHDTHIWQLLRNFKNVSYIKPEVIMQALVQQDVDLLSIV